MMRKATASLLLFVANVMFAFASEAQIASAPAAAPLSTHRATVLAAPWSSGAYAYDGAGNITAIGTDLYTYDKVGRLKTATMSAQTGSQSYTYDALGTMTAVPWPGVHCVWGNCQESPPKLEPATNRFATADSVHAPAYDQAGNLI